MFLIVMQNALAVDPKTTIAEAPVNISPKVNIGRISVIDQLFQKKKKKKAEVKRWSSAALAMVEDRARAAVRDLFCTGLLNHNCAVIHGELQEPVTAVRNGLSFFTNWRDGMHKDATLVNLSSAERQKHFLHRTTHEQLILTCKGFLGLVLNSPAAILIIILRR